MGIYLSMPCTKKCFKLGSNRRLVYSLVEMQGWRDSMEDRHAAILDLDGTGESGNAFLAVYDGHSGSSVAKYVAKHLHKRLVTEESYKKQDWKLALKSAFLGTDDDLRATSLKKRWPGSCATAALLTKDKIFVANAGDSRSVLSVMGQAKPLSFDHKPTDDSEKARILGAGGFVRVIEGRARTNGDLALSRALGDFQYKERSDLPPEAQIITADPEITCHEMTEEDEFLIVACDGIWDCLSSQEVVDFVRYQISEGKELGEICESIVEHCLAPDTDGKGCDNMTLIVAGMTHGRMEKEWYEWIKERVKNEYGYRTPSIPPRIYDEAKLISFREKREVHEAQKMMKESENTEEDDSELKGV